MRKADLVMGMLCCDEWTLCKALSASSLSGSCGRGIGNSGHRVVREKIRGRQQPESKRPPG